VDSTFLDFFLEEMFHFYARVYKITIIF
jgi:hypothetical protein